MQCSALAPGRPKPCCSIAGGLFDRSALNKRRTVSTLQVHGMEIANEGVFNMVTNGLGVYRPPFNAEAPTGVSLCLPARDLSMIVYLAPMSGGARPNWRHRCSTSTGIVSTIMSWPTAVSRRSMHPLAQARIVPLFSNSSLLSNDKKEEIEPVFAAEAPSPKGCGEGSRECKVSTAIDLQGPKPEHGSVERERRCLN